MRVVLFYQFSFLLIPICELSCCYCSSTSLLLAWFVLLEISSDGILLV